MTEPYRSTYIALGADDLLLIIIQFFFHLMIMHDNDDNALEILSDLCVEIRD